MDRALERVSRAWRSLQAAQAAAVRIQDAMGGAPSFDDPDQGAEWVAYARERDYDRDIDSLFGDLGA